MEVPSYFQSYVNFQIPQHLTVRSAPQPETIQRRWLPPYNSQPVSPLLSPLSHIDSGASFFLFQCSVQTRAIQNILILN